MPDLATNLLLSVAVFAGAFSSLAGFAFSAVAGAILLRIFQPMEAVPLMMACSIGVQAANLWALRRNIQWEGSLLLIVGGALGTWLRSTCCRTRIRIFCALRLGSSSRCTPATDAGAGCRNNQPAAHGVDRIRRRLYRRFDGDARRHSDHLVRHARGLVQPFIAIMQVLALALLLGRQSLSSRLVIDLAISLPALFAGSLLGIVAFRNINEVGFRRTILVLLLISGASLALA